MDDALVKLAGGKTLGQDAGTGEPHRWFGWAPSVPGTLTTLPASATDGIPEIQGDRVFLWEFLRSVNGGAIPPFSFQFTGSCFPASTPVRMADGAEKPIESVSVGDTVVTHIGKTRAVSHVMSREYTGDMITLHVAGHPFPVTMTADHPVAVWHRPTRTASGRLEWAKAGEVTLEDDVLIGGAGHGQGGEVIDVSDAIPDKEYSKPEVRTARYADVNMDVGNRVGMKWTKYRNYVLRRVPVTASLARLLGLYVAEGGSRDGRVTFTFHRKELAFAEEVVTLIRGCFGVESEVLLPESKPTVCQVRCQNVNLALVMSWLCPGNVYSKRVPSCVMRGDEIIRAAFFRGWMDGDGHVRTGGGIFSATGVTASRELARDVLALASSLGITTSVTHRDPYGRSRDAWSVRLTGRKAVSLIGVEASAVRVRDVYYTTEYGIARHVRRVDRTRVENLKVYDFTVEVDHSFVAGGLVVHNCVNSGAFNALQVLMGIEIACMPDPEQFVRPFTLFAYGRSRYEGFNDATEGEGSLGDAMAKSIANDGVPSVGESADIPDGIVCGPAVCYSRRIELQWSSVREHPPGVAAVAKRHVASYVEPTGVDDAEKLLRRGIPMTFAGNWGGQSRGVVQGTKYPILTMPRRERWDHQQSLIGMWKHPELGRRFLVMNNWYTPGPNLNLAYTREGYIDHVVDVGEALPMHGEHPSIPDTLPFPRGGYWVTDQDVDYQIRTGEVRGLFGFQGYRFRPIDFGRI